MQFPLQSHCSSSDCQYKWMRSLISSLSSSSSLLLVSIRIYCVMLVCAHFGSSAFDHPSIVYRNIIDRRIILHRRWDRDRTRQGMEREREKREWTEFLVCQLCVCYRVVSNQQREKKTRAIVYLLDARILSLFPVCMSHYPLKCVYLCSSLRSFFH